MEIARNIGMEVKEERLLLGDISRYDSCFLTGTSAEIRGVSSISHDNGKIEFSNNELVTRLQKEYAKIVGKIQ